MTPTSLAGYLALFILAGSLFLMANLILGLFIRPHRPTPEKGEIYECGEPTIGTTQVRFDLRFYVVALLFLVFEVEVAFFFPWAAAFGTAVQLSEPRLTRAEAVAASNDAPLPAAKGFVTSRPTPAVRGLYATLGAPPPESGPDRAAAIAAESRAAGESLARLAWYDMLAFFAILLVGFAYCWRRGDLEWVRAVRHHRTEASLLPNAPRPPVAEAGRRIQLPILSPEPMR